MTPKSVPVHESRFGCSVSFIDFFKIIYDMNRFAAVFLLAMIALSSCQIEKTWGGRNLVRTIVGIPCYVFLTLVAL